MITSLLLLGVVSTADMPLTLKNRQFSARIAYVIDVKTYAVDVSLPYGSQRIKVALDGVVAPELYGNACERRAALEAKAFVQSILWPNETVIVRNLRAGRSGVVGDIEFAGRNLAEVLLRFKQVVPEGGATGRNWCRF